MSGPWVRFPSEAICGRGVMSVHSGAPSSAARLHNKGGVLCVTVYGIVQDKDPLGAFGIRKSKSKVSRPGLLIWRPNNTNVVLVEP